MKRPALILSFIGICLGIGGWMVVDSKRRGPEASPTPGGVAAPVSGPAQADSRKDVTLLDRMDRELIVREWRQWLGKTGPDRIGSPAGTTGEVSVLTNLVISAIWLQEGHRMAVVNGRVVHEGHRVSPFRIRRIEPGMVTFSGPTGDVSIQMRPDRRSVAGGNSPLVKVPGSTHRSGRASGQ